ncbi:MAG: hypothetical protein NTV81_02850 [Candidatus Komeilibacteria bacterium]|nr:hypothetical protein [Candidatus Komeilibacteria bacterium]
MNAVCSWLADTLMSFLNFIMPALDYIGPTMSSPLVINTMIIVFWAIVAGFVVYYHVDQRLHALISLALIGYLYAADYFAMPACHWLQGVFPGVHWMAVDAIYVIPVMIIGYLALCLGDRLQGPKRRLSDGINIFRRSRGHYGDLQVDESVLRDIGCGIN